MDYKPTAETIDIVKRLGGTWNGRSGSCRCPVHDDHDPSLSITQGEKGILVKCFADCDRTEILRAIRAILGGRLPRQRAEPLEYRPKSDAFKRIWSDGVPIQGTIAERYLKTIRGIDFIPPDIRFNSRTPQGKSPDTKFLPALLVGIFRKSELTAIQRIFLDPKTACYTSKMIIGNSRGGIWPSRFSTNTMAIAEGFETACAFQQITDLDTGTCFGTANFGIFEVPDTIERITFLPDNDLEGCKAVDRAIPIRSSQGYQTRTKMCPPNFGDWADILRPRSETPGN